MSVETWERVESEEIAECRVFRVRRDRCRNSVTRNEADFFVIENPDWVNVIPITKDGNVVLVRQYRYGTESVTLEIPGGMVDEGETPESTAKRELLEETGYSAGRMVYLGRSHPNPALQQNMIYHFAALGCEPTTAQELDDHESIETHLVPQSEIARLIDKEEITHSLVIAGFHRFEAYRKRGPGHIYES